MRALQGTCVLRKSTYSAKSNNFVHCKKYIILIKFMLVELTIVKE